jgi:hypothetical protein
MDGPNSDLNDQALDDNDRLMAQVMPDAFAAMVRNRIVKAGQPAIAPAPKPEPPDLTVALITPEAMKQPEGRENALASLASLAYAASTAGYQNGLKTKTPALADAYLSQAARQALTVAALIEGLNGHVRKVPANKANGKRDRKHYMRPFMRKKRALERSRQLDA